MKFQEVYLLLQFYTCFRSSPLARIRSKWLFEQTTPGFCFESSDQKLALTLASIAGLGLKQMLLDDLDAFLPVKHL